MTPTRMPSRRQGLWIALMRPKAECFEAVYIGAPCAPTQDAVYNEFIYRGYSIRHTHGSNENQGFQIRLGTVLLDIM